MPDAVTLRTAPATRRRVLGMAAAGVATGAVAAACDSGAKPEPGGAKTASLPAELTWMGWSAAQEYLVPVYEEAAAGFAAKHPGTKIVLLAGGPDFRGKYTTLVAAGTPPDVSDLHWQQHVRDVGPSGLCADLTPLLKKDAYPKDYIGWEPYGWRDKQYGVPVAVQSTGLFYNKALFDTAGVKYPDATWTWEQLAEAARRLTTPGADENSTVWGIGDQGGQNIGWMNALLHAFGGGVFTPDYKKVRLTDRESLAAFEFRAGWGSKLNIAANVPGGTAGQFAQGKLAMTTNGSWFVANVKGNARSALNTGGVPWDVAPVPKGPKRHGGLTAELSIGIPAGVRHADASWLAVRHLTSKDGLLPFARVGRYIPPQKSLWPEAVPADGMPAGFKKAFLDQWEQLEVPSPFTPKFQEIDLIWDEELNAVWTGERPVRDGAAAMARRLEEFLKRLSAEGML